MISRRLKIVLLAVLLSASAPAQDDPNPAAIERLKHTSVSSIGKGMPSVEFQKWFAELAGSGAVVTYESNDCGERNGTPDEKGKTFPLCATARVQDEDGWVIELSFQVGTYVASPGSKPILKGPTGFFHGVIFKSDKYTSSVTLANVASAWKNRKP